MASKNSFVKAMDDLPLILKIILCIPFLDIIWAIYRIVKGVSTNNLLMVIIGILWIIPGSAFLWIVDIIAIILTNKLFLA